MLAQEAQHIRFVRHQVAGKTFRQGEHRPAEEGCAKNDLNSDRQDRLRGRAGDFRSRWCCVWIEFHHTSKIGDGFHTAEGENYADEGNPGMPEVCVPRLEVRNVEMTSAEKDNCDNYKHRWQG